LFRTPPRFILRDEKFATKKPSFVRETFRSASCGIPRLALLKARYIRRH
jgi:hypothetical protein